MSIAKDAARFQRLQVGTMLRISRDPAVMQTLRAAGLDCAFIDLEHSLFSAETAVDLIQAGRNVGLDCYVRVPELSRAWIGRMLDSGARGVMVPMVGSAEEAESLVRFAKYPPLGRRGLGQMTGQTDYRKKNVARLVKEANEHLLAIAQIETAGGVENIDAMASTSGIDALLIGPNDLAVSLGVLGKVTHERVLRAIDRVARAARTHGKLFGMQCDLALLMQWIPHGLHLAVSSTDTALLSDGVSGLAGELRRQCPDSHDAEQAEVPSRPLDLGPHFRSPAPTKPARERTQPGRSAPETP